MPEQTRSSLKTAIAIDQKALLSCVFARGRRRPCHPSWLRQRATRTGTASACAPQKERHASPDSSPIRGVRSLNIQPNCGTFAHDRPPLSLLHEKGEAMRKTLMALAAVATLAVSAVAAPQAAEARGGRVAAGVAAGLIGGAIVGGAIASQNGYYGPGYYGPGYGYTAGRPMSRSPAASGSASGSGTVMAGGLAMFGSATKPIHLHYKPRRCPWKQAFSGTFVVGGLKKPLFPASTSTAFTFD